MNRNKFQNMIVNDEIVGKFFPVNLGITSRQVRKQTEGN